MRNVPFTSNVGGSELIGVVRSGKKFPFGTVSEETYNADLADITERIQNVGEVAEHAVNSIAEVSTTVDSQGVRITTAEHAIASQSQAIASLSDRISTVSAQETTDYAELTLKVNAAAGAVSSLEVAANLLRTDFTALEHRVDTAEAAISAQAAKEISDIAAVETAIDGLNSNINALNTRENNDISAVNGRIDALNTTVTTQGNRIEAVNTALTGSINNVNSALGTRIDDLAATERADIASVNSSISTNVATINAAISEANADIADLSARHTTDINAINGRIDTTNNTVSTVRSDLTAVSNSVETLSESVDKRVAEINRRIDDITGDDTVTIVSFTAKPNVCELGGTENVILTWTTTGNVNTTKINGVPVTGNTHTVTVTTDTNFTLEIAPLHGVAVSKTIEVKFVNHIFWGVNASAAMDEGAVKALDHTDLSDERTRSFTASPNNQYIYYAYPARLGASVFFANGFEGGFTEPASISIDNHSGVSENYYVYRSNNILSGTIQIEVR